MKNRIKNIISKINFLPEWNVEEVSASGCTIARLLIKKGTSTVVVRLCDSNQGQTNKNSELFWEVFGNFPYSWRESPIKRYELKEVEMMLECIETGLIEN